MASAAPPGSPIVIDDRPDRDGQHPIPRLDLPDSAGLLVHHRRGSQAVDGIPGARAFSRRNDAVLGPARPERVNFLEVHPGALTRVAFSVASRDAIQAVVIHVPNVTSRRTALALAVANRLATGAEPTASIITAPTVPDDLANNGFVGIPHEVRVKRADSIGTTRIIWQVVTAAEAEHWVAGPVATG
jgi:hypothetical protein